MSAPRGGRRPGGSSTTYKAATAAIICRQLIEGRSLKAICRQEGMPGLRTVYDWLDQEESFSNQIARARRLQAHTFVDELQDIIAVCLDIVNGGRAGTMEQIQAAKVCADNYRWIAGRALPSAYGDKVLHTDASGEGPVAVKLALDYSLLAPHEMVEFRRMLAKMERPDGALMIEDGAAEDEDGEAGS